MYRDSGFSETGTNSKETEDSEENPRKVVNLAKKFETFFSEQKKIINQKINITKPMKQKTLSENKFCDFTSSDNIKPFETVSNINKEKTEEMTSDLQSENLSVDYEFSNQPDINNTLSDKSQKILQHKIQELVNTEIAHIEKLGKGIEIYIQPIKNLDESHFVNKYENLLLYLKAFKSIEKMYEFHIKKVLQAFLESRSDPYNLAQVFYAYFADSSFYIYIRYACDCTLIESLIKDHEDLFDDMSKTADDRMGISHFMKVPFERLRQYMLLFGDIYKVLQNDENCSTDLLRIFFRLKERLGEHVQTFNDALHLRLIEQYSQKIDWSSVGQFKKMGQFTISCRNQRYPSKVFLFDQNILITKVIDDETLETIDFISVRDIQYINADHDEEFVIVSVDNHDIQFNGDTKVVSDWVHILASESDRESLWFDTGEFNEGTILKSLQKIENHFKYFMLKTDHMQRFPKTLVRGLTFSEVYMRVIEFHCNIINPALESEITNITEFCQYINQWLKDPLFLIYKEYAYLAAIVLIYFQSSSTRMETEFETEIFELESLIQAPLKHLIRYKRFFSGLIKRLSRHMTVAENRTLVKVVVQTSNEFNAFVNLVLMNYEFKTKFPGLDFGVMQYCDLVTEKADSSSYNLMLFETAVAAVDLLNDNIGNSLNGSIKNIKWSIPFNDVLFEYCSRNSEQIFIFWKSDKRKRFSVIFRSTERRKEFLQRFVVCF